MGAHRPRRRPAHRRRSLTWGRPRRACTASPLPWHPVNRCAVRVRARPEAPRERPPRRRVQLDSPVPQLDRLFDYAIPHPLVAEIVPGVRCEGAAAVGRPDDGCVRGRGRGRRRHRAPAVVGGGVVSTMPVLPERLFTLARKVADRAAGSVSDVLRLAVPKRMVRAEKAWLTAPVPETPVVPAEALARADAALKPYVGSSTPSTAASASRSTPLPTRPLLSREARGRSSGRRRGAHARTGEERRTRGPGLPRPAQLMAALADLVPPEAVVATTPTSPVRCGTASTCAPRARAGDRRGASVGGLRPRPRHGPGRTVGRRRFAARRAAGPGVHARDAALVRQELEGSALVFAGHTRSTDVQRLVEVGYVRESAPARRPESAGGTQRDARGGVAHGTCSVLGVRGGARSPRPGARPRAGRAPRIRAVARLRRLPSPRPLRPLRGPLRAARPGAVPVCAWCGRSAHAWTCGHCGSVKLRMASSGSERTADELGRAFPNTRVIIADGGHRFGGGCRPGLVIATRGAEPIARGGYRAVILLDGDRMLQNEALRVGEHCLRWWSNAAALAAPGAPVHLVGVAGRWPARSRPGRSRPTPGPSWPTARRCACPRPCASRASRDTPGASTRSSPSCAPPCPISMPSPSSARSTRPRRPDAPTSRALVRFDYAHGRAVADALRAGVIADALRRAQVDEGEGAETPEYTQSAARSSRARPLSGVARSHPPASEA